MKVREMVKAARPTAACCPVCNVEVAVVTLANSDGTPRIGWHYVSGQRCSGYWKAVRQ